MYPDATVEDYMNAMFKPCEFHEYKNMHQAEFLQYSRTPIFKGENNYDRLIMKGLTPEEFINTDVYNMKMQAEYETKVKKALINKERFLFRDALDDVAFITMKYRKPFTPLKHNVYVPTRNTIMKRPNIADNTSDSIEVAY